MFLLDFFFLVICSTFYFEGGYLKGLGFFFLKGGGVRLSRKIIFSHLVCIKSELGTKYGLESNVVSIYKFPCGKIF